MKNSNIFVLKNGGQFLRAIVPAACLLVFELAMPLCKGQIVTGQKTKTTQQVTTQKIITPQQIKTEHLNLKPVKISSAELRTLSQVASSKSFTTTQSVSKYPSNEMTLPLVNNLEVISPVANDIWEAGREYLIKWNGGSGEVRIDLELVAPGKPMTQYQIVNRTPNTGTYRFKVPYKWVGNPHDYIVRIKTLDGKQNATSKGTITVYTQPVDLECRIVDASLKESSYNAVVYYEEKRWIEFNVLMRNKGTLSPVTLQTVLVRIIKQPEGVVVAQEEWGFSGIYNHDWYKLPEPRKFNISSKEDILSDWSYDINFKSGHYSVEIELDPQNRLGEDPNCRDDNKCVSNWKF